MKIKVLIEKATQALHGAIRGERRPRPIIFDSIKDLSDALIRAKEAHSEFERSSGAKDYNWPLWYAAYIAMEQGLAEKSASKLAGSAIEVSPGQKMRHRLDLDGNPLGHERDGSETSRQGQFGVAGMAVTVGRPRRRTMICRMLRYFVTATLFSTNGQLPHLPFGYVFFSQGRPL